jgi:hypothetical protein
MCQLDSGQSNRRRAKGLESSRRSASLLDRPMILLNHIIQVAARAYFYGAPAAILLKEQTQASVGGLISVEIDLVGPRVTGDN